jgi:hypothetical protein
MQGLKRPLWRGCVHRVSRGAVAASPRARAAPAAIGASSAPLRSDPRRSARRPAPAPSARRPPAQRQQAQPVRRWPGGAPSRPLVEPSPAVAARPALVAPPADAAPSPPAANALPASKRFGSWRNVQSAFQQHRHQLSRQDFQLLLQQLGLLVRPQYLNRQETSALRTFLDDLSSYAQETSATLRAQDWAVFITLLGQLQHPSVDPHLLHHALLALGQNLDGVSAAELARTISNAVSLGAAPAADLKPLVHALGAHLGAQAAAPSLISAEHIEPVITALKKVRAEMRCGALRLLPLRSAVSVLDSPRRCAVLCAWLPPHPGLPVVLTRPAPALPRRRRSTSTPAAAGCTSLATRCSRRCPASPSRAWCPSWAPLSTSTTCRTSP